jgi:hypothetical protein
MSQHHESPRRPSPAQLLTVLLLVVACTLVPLLYVNLLESALNDLENREWGAADFTAYYTAGRLIRSGTSPYNEEAFAREMESLGFRDDRPYIYFPLLAIAITPLTLFPPRQAVTIWFWFNLALHVASTILMIRTLRIWKKQKIAAVAVLLAALTFYPGVFSVFVGQANSLLLALLVLAWYLARRGSDKLAGVAIAAASLVKIFPFCAALYFLWKGKYKLFLCTFCALLILVGFSIAVVGLDPHVDYVESVLPTQFAKPHPLNQSLSAFLARALPTGQMGGLPLWQLLSLSASAVLVLGTVLLIPPGPRSKGLFDLEFSLVVMSMLLVSTVSWVGTLTLLILPYAVVAANLAQCERKDAIFPSVVALVSFLAINWHRVVETYPMIGSATASFSPWLLSMPMYGMIALWLTIARLISRDRESPVSVVK